MRFHSFSQAVSARASRRFAWRPFARGVLTLLLAAGLVVAWGWISVSAAVQEPAPHAAGEPARAGHAQGEHAEGALPAVARFFNFAILAGVLFYFLKTPLADYLTSRRTQIRQDLTTAAEMRLEATNQLARIDASLKALPAELEALRARGAEDVIAERERIARAAAEERERLLAHTRREIDMQLRIARRSLVEEGAQLAVNVAQARIERTITPEDQLRLVDRYAAQLQEAR
jgi:F-type H+-transporting ATPase subunit b